MISAPVAFVQGATMTPAVQSEGRQGEGTKGILES